MRNHETPTAGHRPPPKITTMTGLECVNSIASDDHTGMDSFHECLQEYGEGLEVVQICLEPEEASIKDDELSALCDLSFDECKRDQKVDHISKDQLDKEKVNGITEFKSSKSEESLDEPDDDMTITEDDVLVSPREFNIRSKSADRKETNGSRSLSKQNSKDLSTSDEMVFAVTPTGLERISFEKYWKDCGETKEVLHKVKSDESWKECLNSPTDEASSFYDTTTRISVQEENNTLLYIDHEIDGYETCLDDDSSSVMCAEKNGYKINGDREIKDFSKQNEVHRNKDNDACAKTNTDQNIADVVDDSSYTRPYVQEHIIKQMKSLRIEPLNVNISTKKIRKKSPTKPSKNERRCIEYYNDQDECLKEIRQKKLEEEKRHKEERKRTPKKNIAIEKKMMLKKQEPSEESTDLENNYVPDCHKCFLENYAYAITKAYIAEATACKFCEVIREMLEPPKRIPDRRMSAPASISWESGSESEEECLLAVPVVKDRRKSAGPLTILTSPRRSSHVSPNMTVTVSPDRHTVGAQRWGPSRSVTLKRSPGAPLGVSIVGGKVDIISNQNTANGSEKAIFGIFIKNVVPDSPAGLCGELHNTDSSDVDVTSPTPSRTLSYKKGPAPPPPTAVNQVPKHDIKITVTSEAGTEKEGEIDAEKETKEKGSSETESSKPVYSDSESSDEEDERELSGRTYSEKGVEIDRASAGAIKRTKEEKEADPEEEDDFGYTTMSTFWRENGTLSHGLCAECARRAGRARIGFARDLETCPERVMETISEDAEAELELVLFELPDRFSPGLSSKLLSEISSHFLLAYKSTLIALRCINWISNKIRKKYASLGDSIVVVKLERSPKAGLGLSLAGHRDRSRMAVFICGLHPAGSAAKSSPPIKVGDEILEVNGIVLHGRCHLNASAIIKGLVGPVFKIILLRRKSALEDVAVKPLTQFPVALDEESEDRFAGYKGVRDITIKKGPAGLGIMIIEGRHTEAGRGIFVSDLQEGSAAEQAGLNIGDMILAVNRDSLLSCSYDAAAAKLKHTEGVVILTVCSPNMKDPDKEDPSGASGNQTPDALSAGASRPQTPRPAPSPAKAEPPPDPATAPVKPNQEMVIEINSNNENLGVVLLGGSDTLINGAAAVLLDIYKTGAIGKDGRLQVGDQIRDCNGIAITNKMAHERVCLSIKLKAPKLKLTVFRPDPIQYEEVEVELTKKAGRVLGLTCIAPVQGTGVYIGDLLPGSPAEVDGRIQKGDLLVSVDGKDLSGADYIAAATALKLCANKTTIKVKRFKIISK
ncbi:Inactivation-no-after-potential D protein [Papilio xuthus]|uniref:Inactivation-no-after-potential D protein n=1 Tax=Papilio xuthus TaxID=66420 RepID=A0A0N1IDD6_PAPXU|nr:Inactivation-no-after-potential D protein [Papilio xuthus]